MNSVLFVFTMTVIQLGVFTCSALNIQDPEPGQWKKWPWQKQRVTYTSEGILLCDRFICRSVSYSTLKESYGNSFFSIKEYSNNVSLQYKCPRCQLVSDPPSDGSVCCPSHIYATYFDEYEPKYNTNQQKCNIINLPDQKQMVTIGVCEEEFSPCTGGRCIQMYTTQSLLAYNRVTSELRPEYFDIPTYCTCKNITPPQ